MRKKIESEDSRIRCFATLIYTESEKPDWREILSSMHCEALVSPLHDKDKFKDGSPKKPHYHIEFYFRGKKSLEQCHKMVDELGGVGLEILTSKGGYARYLCHLDEDPDIKPHYSPSDVRAFGGANFMEWAELDKDCMMFIPEIQDFIETHDVKSFYKLCRYARLYKPDWHRVLATKSSVYFDKYIKSRVWTKEQGEDDTYDIISGAINEGDIRPEDATIE